MNTRHILDGMLGCPVCGAEFPIRHGVVDFRRGAKGVSPRPVPDAPDQGLRLAAMLDLVDARGFALLVGGWGTHALELMSVVEIPLILIDPPEHVSASPGVSILRSSGELPVAPGAARATAIDGGEDARVASAVRATKENGRVVAPIAIAMPGGVREIARDAALWVGEREPSPSPLVSLHVRRG